MGERMNSPSFKFRIPTTSKAYSWIMEKQDAGENVSRALRFLIESHGDIFDTLYARDEEIVALKRQLEHEKNKGSSQFQAKFNAEADKLARIKKADRAR
jgi:hypothetical protein